MRFTLTLHPQSRCAPVKRIDVDVARLDATRVALSYVIAGAVADIALPPPAPSSRTDDLWKHTCVEVFFRAQGSDAYSEINLAPSTQWAAYSFTSYREGMAPLDIASPRIDARTAPERYQLQATLNLPMLANAPAWRLGLSAVIETIGRGKSYWALAHAPGKPDFHHPDSFAYDLPTE